MRAMPRAFRKATKRPAWWLRLWPEAWRKEPYAYDLDGAVKALEMSREKAVAMMGSPSFEVTPAPVQPMPDTVN